jgi:outer membrane biosynthesis protein TonB
MRLRFAYAGLLLPLLLAACVHDKNQAQVQPPLSPPIEDAPPPKPNSAPANLPPPVVSVPAQEQSAQPQPAPAPAPKRRSKPAQPASTETPEVSAAGDFTPADPADLRRDTVASIAETERGLNSIKRKLSDQEQKTSSQIREYIKQAKSALDTGDVDGAHTLALKAKVLLGELTQ